MPDDIRPILRAELRELQLLTFQNESEKETDNNSQAFIFIRNWIEELGSTSLKNQLTEEIGPASWSHHLEQRAWEDRVRKLAERFLSEDGALMSALPWLNSSEAKSAFELGVEIGRLDFKATRLDELVEACKASSKAELLRGYFSGLSESFSAAALPTAVRKKANLSLDSLWEKDSSLAFAAMLAAGDFLDAFSRTILAVSQRKLAPRYLENFKAWNGHRRTNDKETLLACHTLLALAEDGVADAASDGLEFLQFLVLRNTDKDGLAALTSLFGEDLANVAFGLLEASVASTGRISHAFGRLFMIVMQLDPRRAIRLVVQLLTHREYEVAKLGFELFAPVAKIDSTYLMERVGSAMLTTDRTFESNFRKVAIGMLPSDVVVDWLRQHGVEGARVLARHLPSPYLDNGSPNLDPITEYLMTTFGGDDAVYALFVAGQHSGSVFTGPISRWMTQKVELAEHFITSQIPAISKWARSEVDYGTQQAAQFRQQEEEEGLV